jgi:hypothetical protein
MSLPLDSDGFLRRQCPTCERELKWLAKEEEGEDPLTEPEGGYFCPYCAIQAPSDSWWTDRWCDTSGGAQDSALCVVSTENAESQRRDAAYGSVIVPS